MNSKEIEQKTADILAAAQINYTSAHTGATKRGDWCCDTWRVRFASNSGQFETDYFTGMGLRKALKGAPADKGRAGTVYREAWERRWLQPVKPSAASVLHSLILDSRAMQSSFPEWCADYGCSDDSIDAFETYRKCCAIARDMRAVFKAETLAELETALQDY